MHWTMDYRIAPIDIDVVGWSEMPLGRHNAFGIISRQNDTLHGYAKTEAECEAIASRLM